MKRYLIFACMLLMTCQCLIAEQVDLEQEYRKLDKEIKHVNTRIQQREKRIIAYQKALGQTADGTREQYSMCRHLYEEYNNFMSDSAIIYLNRCIFLAETLHDTISSQECRLMLASQCADLDRYQEAVDVMRTIVDQRINDNTNFRRALMTLARMYGSMARNSKIPYLQNEYSARSDYYLSQIDTTRLSMDDDESLQLKEHDRYAAGDAAGALHYNDMRLKLVREESLRYPAIAFSRCLDYKLLGDSVQTRYWAAQAALSHLRKGDMNPNAMLELANLLYNDGDQDRAYRYVHFAWWCAFNYPATQQNHLFSPALFGLTDYYEASIKRSNRAIVLLVALIIVLAGALALTMRKRDRLRQELDQTLEARNRRDTRFEPFNPYPDGQDLSADETSPEEHDPIQQ